MKRALLACLLQASLCLALAAPARVAAAPAVAKAPQKEHKIAAQKRVSEASAVEQKRSAQQPSNRLEALHYFRDRRDGATEPRGAQQQALLDGLIAQHERAAVERRDQAVGLLERFIAETPEAESEMADALLRLSELTWETARSEHMVAFELWQKLPENKRSKQAPLPDYTRTLALYDRLIEKHPQFERLDLVLFMRAFTLLERGEEDQALPLFKRILAEFPESRFRPDAHMALAEHVFNTNYDYRAALAEYDQVLAFEDSELYDLALFKSAWCLWQLDRKSDAALRFRKVLDIEGRQAEGSRRRHLKELQSEALEYLIQVFTEDERNRAADVRRFLQEIGGERHVQRVLTRLSVTYYDQARFDRGIEAYLLLLELDPKHEKAPQYQLAIAKGYMAIDRYPAALEAYRKLATDYGTNGVWATQQADDDTVTETQKTIEQALREQALSLHELGQRDGQKEQLERAVAMYRVYLEAFPKEPESYRLTFYLGEILFHRLKLYPEAGEVYLTAAQLNPKGEFTRDALYNAIGSFEQVREREIKHCSESAPCPETENDKQFSHAIELYAAYYPNDPDLPEILFRQGKLYYDRRIYDPAVRLFGELLERFPQSPYAADAGELVLDSFNRAADYENIERWSRKLKGAPAFKSAEAQKRLDGLILGAVFKSGEQLAEKGEHQRAADAYLRAAGEFPRDPRAPKALYNAGLELSRAGSLEGADKAYSELVAKYPGSSEGAEGAWKGAEMYESIAQFRDAARFYEAYAERFPKAEKTEQASYNAVLLLASAGAHRDAVKAGKHYLTNHPKGPASADVTFLIGRAQEADGQPKEAASTYRQFIERTGDVDRRIEANTRLGQLLFKAGDRKGADAALSAAVNDGRNKRQKPKAGRFFAAQARFIQGDEALREFDEVKIEGNLAGLGARLKLKAKLLGKAAGVYAEVVEFGVAEWVTAALYKIGDSYERFAKALNDAPLPEGLSENEQQVYRDELASFVVPIEERALTAYEGGYKKARELGIYNSWTTQMREALTRLNDVAYPKLNEIGGALAPASEFPKPPVIEGKRRAVEPRAAAPRPLAKEHKVKTLVLCTLALLAACTTVQKPKTREAEAAESERDDRAMRLFVDGAEQLARGTPKSLTRAQELLTEALSLNPKLWEAEYDLGLTYRRRGDLETAREHLGVAAQLSPQAVEPLWALAECELSRGDRDRAAALLEKFVALAPTRVDARLALAAVQRERGRLDEALTVARAVLIKDARETQALLEIGRIYRARGELDVTELVLEKARALLPADGKQSAPVYNELGLLALARGDTQLAFTHFARAEGLDAHFTPAHVNQGSVLLRAGDYEAAERAYRAALLGEPKEIELGSLDARIGLGIAQRGQGKYREARATYEKVLEGHPSFLPAIYDLAVLLADFLDQRKEALPLFERYLAFAPKTDSHRESAERYLQDIRMAMGSTP